MTPNEHLQRYGRVGQYIHLKTCQNYNASYAKNCFEHKPQKVIEAESVTTLWDFSINTDRTI